MEYSLSTEQKLQINIEILSPQYSADRDGNQNTMPENNLSKDYQAPEFRLNPLNKFLNKPKNNDGKRTGDL